MCCCFFVFLFVHIQFDQSVMFALIDDCIIFCMHDVPLLVCFCSVLEHAPAGKNWRSGHFAGNSRTISENLLEHSRKHSQLPQGLENACKVLGRACKSEKSKFCAFHLSSRSKCARCERNVLLPASKNLPEHFRRHSLVFTGLENVRKVPQRAATRQKFQILQI